MKNVITERILRCLSCVEKTFRRMSEKLAMVDHRIQYTSVKMTVVAMVNSLAVHRCHFTTRREGGGRVLLAGPLLMDYVSTIL